MSNVVKLELFMKTGNSYKILFNTKNKTYSDVFREIWGLLSSPGKNILDTDDEKNDPTSILLNDLECIRKY